MVHGQLNSRFQKKPLAQVHTSGYESTDHEPRDESCLLAVWSKNEALPGPDMALAAARTFTEDIPLWVEPTSCDHSQDAPRQAFWGRSGETAVRVAGPDRKPSARASIWCGC